MNDRHLHFTAADAFWTFLVILAVAAMVKYLTVDRFHVPGLSELVAYVFGGGR